jgi:serine/threonine protein phosphatase 1
MSGIMKALLSRIISRRTPAPRRAEPRLTAPEHDGFPRPETHLYAIGDIHGCADLLEPLLEGIDAHVEAHGAADARLAFLGDYIDRGPDSAGALSAIRGLERAHPDRVICLMGNHERMMLDFLGDPARAGFWLRNGGVETLESFGIPPEAIRAGAFAAEGAEALRRRLRTALPSGMEDWLRSRPLLSRSGNVWMIHAAANPDVPLSAQSERTLLWGHPEFLTRPRDDGAWVVHGHTVVETPLAQDGRIAVDTGAVYTGRLTAAAISPAGEVDFLEATSGP